MILGFTGSQRAPSVEQFDALHELVIRLAPAEAHHGDCIGSDYVFHHICLEFLVGDVHRGYHAFYCVPDWQLIVFCRLFLLPTA